MIAPLRGQVFWVDLGYGRKPWVVVSNNQRNRNLDTVLAARITTTSKHAVLPTWIELAAEDPLTGYVLADDIVPLYRDADLSERAGALGPTTMARVNEGLSVALGLSR